MLRLVAAGILAIPALLWNILTIPISIILSLPAALLLLSNKTSKPTKLTMKRHVIITGGSSGIGLAIAKLAAQRDDIQKVILLARNLDKLNAARDSIQTDTEITVHSVDVTDATAVHECVDNIMNTDDDIATHVFCCAGEPHPAYFETISAPSYEHLVRINQLGSMYVANAFLKVMKLGTVQLCSSMGGQIGVFGFSAYAPTKFALRGYAECLHMVWEPSDSRVQQTIVLIGYSLTHTSI